MKKRFGFTLAEVLVTLGLLGVLSAMTIPTLTYNYRSKLLETQFKNTYSDLKEIGSFLNNEYGDVGEHAATIGVANWAKEIISHLSGGRPYKENANSDPGENNIQTAIWNMYSNATSKGLYSFRGFKSGKTSIFCDNGGIWTDSKGRIWTFNAESKIICVDINGLASPNTYNIDIFAFIPMSASQVAQWVYEEDASESSQYTGQIVVCDAESLRVENNSNAKECSEGPNKPNGDPLNQAVTCALDLCPFNFPLTNISPRYSEQGDETSTTVYSKNRLGKALNEHSDYWKDYIQYK